MALPKPKPGLVIRYDYLWRHEAAAGRDQGKDRPACPRSLSGACFVVAGNSTATPRFVVIQPITRTAPAGDTFGIEIPPRVCQAIGVDDVPNWMIVSEHNVDEWPNGGLAPIPGRPGIFSYGFLPAGLFAQIKAKFLKLSEHDRKASVRR